jgi:phage head maturation protease
MQRERKDTRTFSGEKGSPFEIDAKAINDQGEFEGYLSVFGNVDQGGDVVAPGAFAKSLQSRPPPKVKLLLQHDRYTPSACGPRWSRTAAASPARASCC